MPGIRRHCCGKILTAVVLSPTLFWPSLVVADAADVIPVVEAALTKLDATNLDEDWSFTMNVVEGEETRIVSSDPHREKYQARELLLVNGVAPDKKRLEEFRETEIKRIDDLDPDKADYRYLVDAQTLQITNLDERNATLSFQPRIKALEDERDKMRGTLVVDLNTGEITEIEILNSGELSPAFSVTVDTYRLTLRFQEEQGANLLSQLESHAVGKAGFVKRFESLVTVGFSDYSRAAP